MLKANIAAIAGCCFWSLLICFTIWAVLQNSAGIGAFAYADAQACIAIPTVMLAMTIALRLLVPRATARTSSILWVGGTALAIFAALLWLGNWAADV